MKLVCLVLLVVSVAGEAFADDAKIESRTFTYKRVGDLDIQADVYSYPGTGKQPAVVLIHGGALIMGDRRMLVGKPSEQIIRHFLDGGFKVVRRQLPFPRQSTW